MTRQKKEIINKIAQLDLELAAKEAEGFADATDDAYVRLAKAVDDLQEELARLSHFDTYLDYVLDPRWIQAGMELPLPFA